jgi:hypothetical protein
MVEFAVSKGFDPTVLDREPCLEIGVPRERGRTCKPKCLDRAYGKSPQPIASSTRANLAEVFGKLIDSCRVMQTGILEIDRQLARWYPLKDHPVQLASRRGGAERSPLSAGPQAGARARPSGSSASSSSRRAFRASISPRRRRTTRRRKSSGTTSRRCRSRRSHPKPPSESDRIIYLPNGSEIHVIGLDKPQRIEGIPWKGGGIDEFADVKEGAWEENILPALNTVSPLDPDYRAWCWLFGVPEGLNHYYELCERAEHGGDPNFKVFHWKSRRSCRPT